MSEIKFQTGPIVATAGLVYELEELGLNSKAFRDELLPLLNRHVRGDWGDVDAHDRKANDRAVKSGARILSAYEIHGVKVWLITESEVDGVRYGTTIMRPEDY